MACRDCKWWRLERPKTDKLGRCQFPMPESVESVWLMFDTGGEGCPQFKERTDEN